MEELRILEDRREQILKEMREIRAMRRGSVMEQYLKVKRKGRREKRAEAPPWRGH